MEKGKILFLDDEQEYLDSVKEIYEENISIDSQVEFEFYNSFSDLSERIKKSDYNTIVSDLRMEPFSGIDVLQIIRKKNPHASLVLLTGQLISIEEQKRCKDIKANFLFKGQGFENLLRNIIYLSQETQKEKQVEHVFVSYRRYDTILVNKIVDSLEKSGIDVWMDRTKLLPGEDWQLSIQKAIQNGMYFLACFSNNYWKGRKNYMNEELQIAIDELRKMPDDQIWFIPVKLDDCKIPTFQIRQNKDLGSKQIVDLHENWKIGIEKIIGVIKR